MRIATWNVNSLKVRLEQLLAWLRDNPVEVVLLQETKCPDDAFPVAAIEAAGYRVWFRGQKSYNGVAILSRLPGEALVDALPGVDSEQKRFLAVTIAGVQLVNVYVPNGQAPDSDKYAFKLAWLAALERYLGQALATGAPLLVGGDFNIAPHDIDCHDPAAWAGGVLVSTAERAAFQRLLALPLVDCLRQGDPAPGRYTWWDYRMGAFRRNAGLRIDHLLASRGLAARLTGCHIDRTPRGLERPSDHTPLVATFQWENCPT